MHPVLIACSANLLVPRTSASTTYSSYQKSRPPLTQASPSTRQHLPVVCFILRSHNHSRPWIVGRGAASCLVGSLDMAPNSAPFSSFGQTTIHLPRLAEPGRRRGKPCRRTGRTYSRSDPSHPGGELHCWMLALPVQLHLLSICSRADNQGAEGSIRFSQGPPQHEWLWQTLTIRPRCFATVRGRCSVFLCTA